LIAAIVDAQIMLFDKVASSLGFGCEVNTLPSGSVAFASTILVTGSVA
jgi:hypothetical protein